MFYPNKEISIAIDWISFPSLPQIFFGKEAMFSLATVVGKSLQVDLATQNKTRLSCVKVKVEVDLLGDSKRINMGMKMKNGKIKEKSINIRYDYMPKHIARFASCRATIRRNALLFIQNCIQKRRKIIKVRRPIKIKKT